MRRATIGQSPTGLVRLDVDRLISTRMLLAASSGGGKSWALRRILEQTHGTVQQIVIDPEGEFYTLRKRYDYVLARKGGDCPAEPRSAALLARTLLKLGVSAILDINDLIPAERKRFVSLFLNALLDAPRELWHPALVVIDEAHIMAPEKGHGEAVSTEAVARLLSQGRKRGFAGVIATQRFAKLAKDVAAECNNVMIGRAAIDVDLKRAADSLGFGKERWPEIRNLQDGEFYAFGPAISKAVTLVQVGDVRTPHPRAGARQLRTPPPREHVRAILKQLREIPQEAIEEAKTIEQLKAEIAALHREARTSKKEIVEKFVPVEVEAKVPAKLKRARDNFVAEAKTARVFLNGLIGRVQLVEKKVEAVEAASAVLNGLKASDRFGNAIEITSPEAAYRHAKRALVPEIKLRPDQERSVRRAVAEATFDGTHSHGAVKILTALAQHPAGLTKAGLRALCGYRRSSLDTYLARLRGPGHVERVEGGRVVATPAGIAALGANFSPLPTGEALLDHWRRELPAGERRILDSVVHRYPEPCQPDVIEAETGYKRSSRDTFIARLVSRALVRRVPGGVLASETLFD